ncbi:f-box domain containing protein [Niveomyces insectorum RCEF 264]|uniref:F-box domain containing protein n=1 Tax=Niveomyces insectorum RCEF 264 TaxID=1081102 RepID=A0A167Z2Z4_9HYPO|nr:f-box domain containing protein [Niveomyces insectorum RCEF 264]
MTLFSLRKIGFLKRKDRQRIGGFEDDQDDLAAQRYLAFGSPAGPEFAALPIKPAGAGAVSSRPATSSLFGLHGGSDSSSSNGNGTRGRSYKDVMKFGNLGSVGNLATFGAHGRRRRRSVSSSARPATRAPAGAPAGATAGATAALLALPDSVLAVVFAFVCPHSQDRTYEKCEDSSLDDGCMLCDMRDLAHCVQTCRRWRPVAERVLYTSIRIDSVHYCEREAILADKRRRRSFFDRNAEPEDTANARLKLLCRTLRDDQTNRLSLLVQFLKIPYMLRESQHADIARTVSVLPNLRYIDLPEGLFLDEPVYAALRLEIQAKCPDLRKMTYVGGAERSMEALASGTCWRRLEVLELVKIGMDAAMLRLVLHSLTSLRALKVTESPASGSHAFSDEVLASSYPTPSVFKGTGAGGLGGYPDTDVPPLEELVLTGTRRVTVDGIQSFLSRPDAGRALRVLTVNGTGVKPWSLPAILLAAPSLRHLTIVDEVSVDLPVAAGTKDIPPLASPSLRTLNYEIKAADNVSPYANVTRSYYNYLSGSILSGGLPNLLTVYVRDAKFPESLLGNPSLPPPVGGDVGGNYRPASSGSAAITASSLNSPLSAMSLAPLQSPAGFLSPHPSPGFAQSTAPLMPPMPPFRQTAQKPPLSYNGSSRVPPPPPSAALAPPSKPWAAGHNPRFSSNNPFASMIAPQRVKTLEVFTKGDDDIDWSSIIVSGNTTNHHHHAAGQTGNTSRPVSSYGLGADVGVAGARKSVFVSTGAGSFLAVPDDGGGGGGGNGGGFNTIGASPGGGFGGRRGSHSSIGGNSADIWPRPLSSSGERKSEKRDLWR